MRSLLRIACACLTVCVASSVSGQVSITKPPTGWELTNGHIQLTLVRAGDSVRLKSLRREGGAEWAVPGTSLLAVPDKSGQPYRITDDSTSNLDKGGKQLTL